MIESLLKSVSFNLKLLSSKLFDFDRLSIIVEITKNTPGTAGGPGGRDRTLAEKAEKTSEKSPFFLKKIKFIPKKYFFFAYIF